MHDPPPPPLPNLGSNYLYLLRLCDGPSATRVRLHHMTRRHLLSDMCDTGSAQEFPWPSMPQGCSTSAGLQSHFLPQLRQPI